MLCNVLSCNHDTIVPSQALPPQIFTSSKPTWTFYSNIKRNHSTCSVLCTLGKSTSFGSKSLGSNNWAHISKGRWEYTLPKRRAAQDTSVKKEWGEETPEQQRSRSRSVSITEADLLTYPRWHFLSAALHIPALLTHSCCESVPPSASDPPQTYLPAQHHVRCTPAWGETHTGTALKACAQVSYRLVLRKLVPAKTLFSSFLIWLFKAPTRTLQQWLWLTYSLSIVKNLTWKSPQKQTNSENRGKGSAFFIN